MICSLLAIAMLLPTSIALAASNAGSDVGGGGIQYIPSGRGNATSNGGSSSGTIDLNGGIKVSFMITSTDKVSY